jgi:hypothetical protein
VSNPGGNIDLVAGSNMTITPNDAANTMTFASSSGAVTGMAAVDTVSTLRTINTDNAIDFPTGTARIVHYYSSPQGLTGPLFYRYDRAELLALKREDIDFDAGEITVDEGVVVLPGGREEFSAPKTDRARRRIPLAARALAAMREHHRRFLEERLRTGRRGRYGNELVFPSLKRPGHAYRGGSLLRRLYRFLDAANLPRVTVHGLRHPRKSSLYRGEPTS